MAIGVRHLTCPKCGLSESVKKVSVATISSLPEDLAIARRIPPPGRPRYSSSWGVWSRSAVVLLTIGLALALVAAEENRSSLWAAAGTSGLLVAYLVLSFALFLIPLGLIVASKERERRIRQRELSIRLRAWERAMAKWEALYYCDRCDGVFFPDRPRLVRADEMEKYLHEAVPVGH